MRNSISIVVEQQLLFTSSKIRSYTDKNRARKPSLDSTYTAFLYATDSFSRMFQRAVKKEEWESIVPKNLSPEIIKTLDLRIQAKNVLVGELTDGIAGLLRIAQTYREQIRNNLKSDGEFELYVRDLMAAFIYEKSSEFSERSDPDASNEQVKDRIKEQMKERWSAYFLAEIQSKKPDEHESWLRIHNDRFGNRTPQPVDTGALTSASKISGHIGNDQYASKDTLYDDAYVRAFERFITHKSTQGPLTICIQAPWGGGKTSLMRMIQKKIDKNPRRLEEKKKPSRIEIDQLRSQEKRIVDIDKGTKRITVWFNAWKYQSVEQAYAGLAEAIILQVSEHLKWDDRAWFWMQLQSSRLDKFKLVDEAAGTALDWISDVTKLMLVNAIDHFALVAETNRWFWGLFRSRPAKESLERQQAAGEVTKENEKGEKDKGSESTNSKKKDKKEGLFSQYISKPDYHSLVGTLHNIELDLRKALSLLPEEHRTIAIFIDDLDRCKPDSIAAVLEAANLFLAGEFPPCIFILGMDSELVAAALQESHNSILKYLSKQAGTPLGWKYMEKFVQLSFIIPPPSPANTNNYIRNLFVEDGNSLQSAALEGRIVEIKDAATRVAIEKTIKSGGLASTVDAESSSLMADADDESERSVDNFNHADAAIDDPGSPIVEAVINHLGQFTHNPREINRFVNSFRFYFYLRASLPAGKSGPSIDQLLNWVQLVTRWSAASRWVLKGSPKSGAFLDSENAPSEERLLALEEAALKSPDVEEWKNKLTDDKSVSVESEFWILDQELFEFIKRTARSEFGRLSAGAGKGLW